MTTIIATKRLANFAGRQSNLHLSHRPRPGDVAQIVDYVKCTHRAEDHVMPRVRLDWATLPGRANPDKVPWEWVFAEPSFILTPADIVMVMAVTTLTHEVPNCTEPWVTPLAFSSP